MNKTLTPAYENELPRNLQVFDLGKNGLPEDLAEINSKLQAFGMSFSKRACRPEGAVEGT